MPQVTGKIEIPNLSEEHEDMEDVDVDVTLTTKGPEATVLKEMLRKGPGAKKVRELLSNYVLALKNEYSSGLILPKKDQAAAPVKTSAVAKPANKPAGGQANEVNASPSDFDVFVCYAQRFHSSGQYEGFGPGMQT